VIEAALIFSVVAVIVSCSTACYVVFEKRDAAPGTLAEDLEAVQRAVTPGVCSHAYEARYDCAPTISSFKADSADPVAIERLIAATTSKTYVCDVCTRCGHKVKR